MCAYKPKIISVSEGGTGVSSAGTSGNVLTSNGSSWTSSSPASSGVVNPPNSAGQTIGSDTWKLSAMRALSSSSSSLGTSSVAQAARIYFYPCYIPVTGSYTKFAVIVTTLGALTNCRFALYNNTNGFPATVLVDSGNQSCTSSGVKESTGLSFSITAGWYWFGLTIDNNPVIFRSQSGSLISYSCLPVGATDLTAANNEFYYDVAFGAFGTITTSSLVVNGHNVVPFFYIA